MYKSATGWVEFASAIMPISQLPTNEQSEPIGISPMSMLIKPMSIGTALFEKKEPTKITADADKVFMRKYDGFIMGNEVVLGIDFSTGEAREDKLEYYEQIDAPVDDEVETNEFEF